MTQSNALHWDSVENYLGSIGMRSDIDIQITKEIFSQANFLCPEELKDIFVSNYNQKDDKEEFKDLWFLCDNYLIEALNFNRKESPKLEMAILSKNIQSVEMEAKDLDFSRKAEGNSRLHIILYIFSDWVCDLIAFGNNCNNLVNIYNKYVKPNIVRSQ